MAVLGQALGPHKRGAGITGVCILSERTKLGNCVTKDTKEEDEGSWLRPETMEVWDSNSHYMYPQNKMTDISEPFVRAALCGKRRPKQTFSEGIGFTPILLGFPKIKS